MMDRLTLSGTKDAKSKYNPCTGCVQPHTTCRECMFREFAELLAARKTLILPCTLGDTVYWLDYNTDACKGCNYYSDFYGMDRMCDRKYELYPEFDLDEDDYCPKHFIEIREFRPDLIWIVSNLDDFSKTVFLTREEAEAALKERESE